MSELFDLYSVPMPRITTNIGGILCLEYRYIIAALYLVEQYPCYAKAIVDMVRRLGGCLDGRVVGVFMRELCVAGFMARERRGAQYVYKPTAWFCMLRAEYMEAVR